MLFIGPFLLLINNDEPKVGLRGKDSTPGTDNDIKFPVSYSLPLVKLLTQRQLGMKDSYLVGEARGESLYSLWGKGDLRNQSNPPLPQPEHLSQGLKVDLCLATPGNPMKEKNGW
jgi:hypothetical protein